VYVLLAANLAEAKDNNNKNVINDTTTTTVGVIGRTNALDVVFVKGTTEICSITGNKELTCVKVSAAKKNKS
jgi:hypothetical protein